MKKQTLAAAVAFIFLGTYTVRLQFANEKLRDELECLAMQVKRPFRPKLRMPPRQAEVHMPIAPRSQKPSARFGGRDAETERGGQDAVAAGAAARIAARRKEMAEARALRRAAIEALTPEQKAEQRDAFISKMRERSTRRLSDFVSKAKLSARQTESFEGTVAALDASLRDAAAAWADQIRETGTFSRDAQIKFTGEIAELLSAGYGEMDATLPETWRTDDGNVNLMEIVGPEALAPVVEALTESGLEDGLQTIGQIMGGPSGGPEENGDDAPLPPEEGGMNGIESPGVGEGPGGMGGPGGGFAPPAAR